ncbi:MAG: hypothetical protein ACOYZ8_08845 [Chloroflexota bacterium]
MGQRLAVVGAASLLLMQACNGGLEFPAAATLTPLPPPTSIQPTETPPVIHTPTAIPSPLPSETPEPTFTPSALGEPILFQAEDGHQLTGYFYASWKPSAPVIVLMHQFGSEQRAWAGTGLIPWLGNWRAASGTPFPYIGPDSLPEMPADLSFAVFTFDFRGHGQSAPVENADDLPAHRNEYLMDAKAAFAAARAMPGVDPNRVILIGASIGADAAVDACAEGCVGAFSVSPGSWLGMDFGDTVRILLERGVEVRCVLAELDSPSPETCRSVREQEGYQIHAYGGKKHGMDFFIPRKAEPRFGEYLLGFLQSCLQ